MASFPQSPLPLSLWIAPGGDPTDASTFNWTEITGDLRQEEGVQITAGRQDEGNKVDSTSVALTLDNRAGNYTPRNPLGRYYGKLGKGTPLQLRLTRMRDLFTRTVATGWGTEPDSGIAWSQSPATAFAVNGAGGTVTLAAGATAISVLVPAGGVDVDVTHVSSVPAVAAGASWVDATLLRYSSTSNYFRLHTEFLASGFIGVKVQKIVGGVSTEIAPIVTTSVAYAAGTRIRTRTQSIGTLIRIKVWPAAQAEPDAWNLQVDDADLTSNQATGSYQWRQTGNTTTSSVLIEDWRVDPVLATFTVAEWPPRWDQSGKDATVPIVGAGILRRLRQGSAAQRSPLYTHLLAQNPAGYWTLEDGSDATVAASVRPYAKAARVTDVSFAADDTLGGSDPVLTLNAFTSEVSGQVIPGPITPNGYGAVWFVKCATIPASDTTLIEFTGTGTVSRWRIVMNNAGYRPEGYNGAGDLIVNPGLTLWGGYNPLTWGGFSFKTTESGSTVTWQLMWGQVGIPFFWIASNTYTGTAEKLTGFRITGQADRSYGHVWLGDNDLLLNDSGFFMVASGYAGELAHARLARLCAAEGVPLVLKGPGLPVPTSSTAMGPQRSRTFLANVEEIENTEQGVVYERAHGLGFVTRAGRYNGAVRLALDFAQGHIAAPPEPTDDDQQLRNSITLKRIRGSEVTVTDPASIALNGTLSDDLEANLLSDDDLEEHATWRLKIGTLGDLRWPRISLNLAKNPQLINTWLRVRPTDRITIANPPTQTPGDLDLRVEGWTQTLGMYSWDVALNCSPGRAWLIGTWDDAGSKWDSASTSLNAAVTSSATSIVVKSALAGDVWSTTAVPYSWRVGGEVMTVTAITAASGSAPNLLQTATVTRAVNGISKALAAGEEVHIATPARYGL